MERRNHKGNCCLWHGCFYASSNCSVLAGRVKQARRCRHCPTPESIVRGLPGDLDTLLDLEAAGLLEAWPRRRLEAFGPQRTLHRPTSDLILLAEASLPPSEQLTKAAHLLQESGFQGVPRLLVTSSLEEAQKAAVYFDFPRRLQEGCLLVGHEALAVEHMKTFASGPPVSETWRDRRRERKRALQEFLPTSEELQEARAAARYRGILSVIMAFFIFPLILEDMELNRLTRNMKKDRRWRFEDFWRLREVLRLAQ